MDQSVNVIAADEPATGSVAQLSQESLELYRQLLEAYSRDSDSTEHISTERLLSEYGRLKIWTEQTGATMQGHGSLEDTLQNDPVLREDVVGIFTQIKVQLSTGMSDRALLFGLRVSGARNPNQWTRRVSDPLTAS